MTCDCPMRNCFFFFGVKHLRNRHLGEPLCLFAHSKNKTKVSAVISPTSTNYEPVHKSTGSDLLLAKASVSPPGAATKTAAPTEVNKEI